MRLWSLHPRYLDAKGLTAVWREGLLAKAVLLGQTQGYRYHPQLIRFRLHPNPPDAIDYYLEQIAEEANKRGYHFDRGKIRVGLHPVPIPVTRGQVDFEFCHLKEKLRKRDPERLSRLQEIIDPEIHPLFQMIAGEIESWEKIS